MVGRGVNVVNGAPVVPLVPVGPAVVAGPSVVLGASVVEGVLTLSPQPESIDVKDTNPATAMNLIV